MQTKKGMISQYDLSPHRFSIPFSLANPKHGTLKDILDVKILKSIPTTPVNQFTSKLNFNSPQKPSTQANTPLRAITPKARVLTRNSSINLESPKKVLKKANTLGNPIGDNLIQTPHKVIINTFTKDSHVRYRNVLDNSKIQIEAKKNENKRGYFILKNINQLQESYSKEEKIKRDKSKEDLNKKMLQARQKNLLEIYLKNERNNVTETERDKFWNFISGPGVNAIIDFRTLDLEPLHVEMADDVDNQKLQHNKKIRKLFEQIESMSNGHYVDIKDIAKLRVQDTLAQLNQEEDFDNSKNDISIEKKSYFQERNRLIALSLNSKIGDKIKTQKNKNKPTEKKRFRRKPNKYDVIESMLGFFSKLTRLNLSLEDFFITKVFSIEPYEKDGAYTFLKSIKGGNYKIIKDLLQHNRFLVYDFDEKKRTGLHLACITGNYEIAKLLLDFNADTEARDKNNLRPLDHAINKNRLDLVQLLLWNKASPWLLAHGEQQIVLNTKILKLIKLAKRINLAISLAPKRKRDELWNQNKTTLLEDPDS